MTTKRTRPRQAGSPRTLDRLQAQARKIERAALVIAKDARALAGSIGRAERR